MAVTGVREQVNKRNKEVVFFIGVNSTVSLIKIKQQRHFLQGTRLLLIPQQL
ncbi:MAG: hypothetical protein ACI89Z_000963 [Porticoccus sp.]|jgi:hypothetical protein